MVKRDKKQQEYQLNFSVQFNYNVFSGLSRKAKFINDHFKKNQKETLSDEPDHLNNIILSALLLPEAVSLEPECDVFLKGYPFP